MARRHSNERGTTLLLFPTAIVIVLMLGAIAIDFAGAQTTRRAALRVAATAADDAASMLDRERFTSGESRLDPAGARAVATESIRIAHHPGELVGEPEIVVDPEERTVTVTITVRSQRFLSGLVPGDDRDLITVSAIGQLDLNL